MSLSLVSSLLPKTQKDILGRKFRVAITIVHRCPYASAEDIHNNQREILENLCTMISKEKITESAQVRLVGSLFHEGVFYWDNFRKEENNSLGQFFTLKRIKRLISRHESLLIKWIDLVHQQWTIEPVS